MNEAKYTTKHLLKALDIKMIRYRGWETFDCLQPSVPSTGQGIKALFSKYDIYKVGLFKQLVEKGIKRELAASYLKQVTQPGDPLQYFHYLYFETVVFTDGSKEVRPRSFSGGTPMIAIKSEGIDSGYLSDEGQFKVLQNGFQGTNPEGRQVAFWEDFFVINFSALKWQIDNALKAME